jgi:hypothetical protein
LGIQVWHVETAHWRATTKEVQLLLDEIKKAIGVRKSDEVVLVLGMTDNAYFLARAEDGSLIPNCRSSDGTYHMHGEIVGSPLDSSRQVFLQLEGLLKDLQDFDKILLAPLPRYLWQSCCDDPDHGPNVVSEGHAEQILGATAAVQKLWRGMAFRSKLRNLKVCDIGGRVKDPALWENSVHLTADGYSTVAQYIMGGFAVMKAKRQSDGGEDGEAEAKRRRDEEPGAAATGTNKKRYGDAGNFVTRQDSFWREGRGGGGYGGGGGRGFRGGGWGSWRGWPAGGSSSSFY